MCFLPQYMEGPAGNIHLYLALRLGMGVEIVSQIFPSPVILNLQGTLTLTDQPYADPKGEK